MSETAEAGPRRTAPLGMLVSALSDIRKSLLPAVAGAYGLRDELSGIGFFAGIAVLAVAIGGIVAVLKWWRTTYVVGAEDIRVETGVLSRAARSVPYERIQDVSLEQPLLARALGLAQVKFETGAGGADELALTWLPIAEGEALRELVRERRDDEAAAAPAGDVPAEPSGEVLFAMPPRRLATFGLFEFSLAAFAIAAGAAQQFDDFLPFDIWDWEGWQARLDGPGHWLQGLGPFAQATAVGMAISTLVVVGFVTGLARTFARDWGFVLTRTAKGFRRQRGLFTKTDVVMPAHRVQAVEVRTRWLRRLFGWHALKFVSLAQDSGSGSHVVAPFGQMDELEPIARSAGFTLPDASVEWRRPAKRAYIDGAIIGAAVPVAASLGLLLSPAPVAAILPLLAVPVIAAGQYFRWRRARHALDVRQVYARHGWLAPRLDVASRVKLQSVEIAQGPLARRGGYATLHLGLAGGTMSFEAVPLADAKKIRDAVLDSIAGVDFSRLNSA
ncbi:Bacterial membrane flanked domain protein [Tsuneonella dongtanensis]|uniref:Bacterial membrane flanked domain protein n=1 Tax=Tsuneonella dongtanensis TaxID=692370 RepID=A0A1B2AAJ4_9SPHN|nr:PH domain-containing protein [Tsuneonella dongtanensis]ANY19152.1 Bacterial membrane flanked domain protein [Tsuneonella dongtanensis]